MSLRASLLEIRISYKFSLFHFFFKNNISHLQKYLISHLQKASRSSFALEVFGSICVKREFVSCLGFKSYLKVIINGVFMQIRKTTCVQTKGWKYEELYQIYIRLFIYYIIFIYYIYILELYQNMKNTVLEPIGFEAGGYQREEGCCKDIEKLQTNKQTNETKNKQL